jgi:hypothetical protein
LTGSRHVVAMFMWCCALLLTTLRCVSIYCFLLEIIFVRALWFKHQ